MSKYTATLMNMPGILNGFRMAFIESSSAATALRRSITWGLTRTSSQKFPDATADILCFHEHTFKPFFSKWRRSFCFARLMTVSTTPRVRPDSSAISRAVYPSTACKVVRLPFVGAKARQSRKDHFAVRPERLVELRGDAGLFTLGRME